MKKIAIPSLATLLGLILATSSASADPPARLAEADRALRTAQLESLRLLALLDQSRVREDDRGYACVDLKLAQVNSFSRTLAERRRRLRAATDPGDIAHERAVIRRLSAQLREAAREGRACLFPEASAGAYTVVEVIREPDMPRADLSRVPDRRR